MPYVTIIKAYAPPGRRSDVEAWYDGLRPAQRLRVRADRLEYLAKLPERLWGLPYFGRFNTGPCKGLGNIKVKVERNHYPLVGFFGAVNTEFTIVSCILKKRRTLSRNDCKTAQARRKLVENNPEVSYEWKF